MAANLVEARLLLFPRLHNRMLLMYFNFMDDEEKGVLGSL